MLGVGQTFFDIFYPIGSYYETSDTTFNPNTANSWYGTWVEDTAGRVLVAQDTSQTEFDVIGETGGNKTHTHGDGSYYATARVDGNTLYFADKAQSWRSVFKMTGSSSSTASTNQGYAIDVAGTSGSGSSLQPYIVIKRWHRTA